MSERVPRASHASGVGIRGVPTSERAGGTGGAKPPGLTIDEWRARVDEIDEAIVRLLNERADCAVAIGRLKREQGMALYQPDRERYVVERARALTLTVGGRLGPAAIGRLFERIIDEARGLELAQAGAAETRGDAELER